MIDEELKLLNARLNDAVNCANIRSIPKFVGFLNAAQGLEALKVAKEQKAKWLLFGGYEGAERTVFGAFPDWAEPEGSLFPIKRIRIVNKGFKPLQHRDILGTLMSLGIERGTIGDIMTDGKDSIVFVLESVVGHILASVDKIGGNGVELFLDADDFVPLSNSFSEWTATVASLRLDCVVSAVCSVSRNKASELISLGMVSVGGILKEKPTAEITEGDILSVRKYGKFIIDNASARSKKGRVILNYRKYN